MGTLCAAGLATMEEMLHPDGSWNMGLIETMLPVAAEIETRHEQAWHRAAIAAIGSVFSKGDVGKKYQDSLQRVLDAAKADQLGARGAREDRHAIAAQKLVDAVFNTPGFTRR